MNTPVLASLQTDLRDGIIISDIKRHGSRTYRISHETGKEEIAEILNGCKLVDFIIDTTGTGVRELVVFERYRGVSTRREVW